MNFLVEGDMRLRGLSGQNLCDLNLEIIFLLIAFMTNLIMSEF